MPRVLLQPRGTAARGGERNFQRSIVDGVPFAACAPFLSPDDVRAVERLGDPLFLWGSTPASPGTPKAAALAERAVGDLVFFYAEQAIVARARIAHLMDNAALAREVWSEDGRGETWQHMMVLADVELTDEPSLPLLRWWRRDGVVQGLALLSQEKSDRFLERWDRLVRDREIWEARDIVDALIGEDIHTVVRPGRNQVVRIEGDQVRVATTRSPEGRLVPLSAVQEGLDLLRRNGSVAVNTDDLGFRSAFVAAVLAEATRARLEGPPYRLVLPEDATLADPYRGAYSRVVNGVATATIRYEQAELRRRLLRGRSYGTCALCHAQFPARLLVAAHIKRRSVCTDDEKRDLPNVAMLACLFGCDALYEHGYVVVDEHGRVRVSAFVDEIGDHAAQHAHRIEGLRCRAFGPASADYFAWHRLQYREPR